MGNVGARGFAVTFGLAMVLAIYREIKLGHRIPEPQAIMRVIWIWAVLAVFAELGAAALATGLGTGLVIALAYDTFGDGVGKGARTVPKQDTAVGKGTRTVPTKS